MPKQVHGVWLPDREDYLIQDIRISPQFAGAGTIQFKKYAACMPHIRQFRHAVDIGANCGIWTRVMARCFPLVTCYEPNAECHEAFRLNNPQPVTERRKDQTKIVLHPYALGHEPGRLKLNTKLRSTGFTRVAEDGDLDVEVRTLDSFELQEVDFIKIDVEGWEHPVIVGAHDTIVRCRPTMIIEQKPNNAELHGLTQFGAVKLLGKWGAREISNISGDVIMGW
jgi:FkbM family methyltransferase